MVKNSTYVIAYYIIKKLFLHEVTCILMPRVFNLNLYYYDYFFF